MPCRAVEYLDLQSAAVVPRTIKLIKRILAFSTPNVKRSNLLFAVKRKLHGFALLKPLVNVDCLIRRRERIPRDLTIKAVFEVTIMTGGSGVSPLFKTRKPHMTGGSGVSPLVTNMNSSIFSKRRDAASPSQNTFTL